MLDEFFPIFWRWIELAQRWHYVNFARSLLELCEGTQEEVLQLIVTDDITMVDGVLEIVETERDNFTTTRGVQIRETDDENSSLVLWRDTDDWC